MIGVLVAVAILSRHLSYRWDMTDDKRYSIYPATKALVDRATEPIVLTNYLTGDMNSGFRRLSKAVEALADEMGVACVGSEVPSGFVRNPIVIHERSTKGKREQRELYPYLRIAVGTRDTIVSLLVNERGLSGEENLNRSIENLEFTVTTALAELLDDEQLPDVMVVTDDVEDTDDNRREVDAHLMEGGPVLWAVSGVQESRWLEQLFRYGVRVERGWIEDRQCVQYPYCYAPLLLTSEASPVTRNLGQISAMMVSPVTTVGGEDGIRKEIILASSTASRVKQLPEVPQPVTDEELESFHYAYIPAAMLLEGSFPSAFRHLGTKRDSSLPARQVVIGSSSVLRTGISGTSNEELLKNVMRWLQGRDNLLQLRQKTVALRLLNDERSYRYRVPIMVLSVGLPLLLLMLVAVISILIHKKRYTK